MDFYRGNFETKARILAMRLACEAAGDLANKGNFFFLNFISAAKKNIFLTS